MGESTGSHSSGNKYDGSRRNRSYSKSNSRNNSRGGSRGGRNNGYRGRGGRRYGGGGRGRRGGGGNRFKGENIPHHKYIAVAEDGYVAPSIYVEDQSYNDFNIAKVLKKNIAKKGYKHPSKIQSEAIPHILDGKDILGLADTGSGKTAAFLIPMMDKVIKDKNQKCLIITPTRELAAQIQDEFKSLAWNAHLYSTLVIGGTSIGRQISQLKRRPQFVIGTPGRMKDLYERRALDLGQFNNLILDEVDRMLDMGFLPDINFLLHKLQDDKQTLFFSATMSDKAEEVARTILKDPVKVKFAKESPVKRVNQNIVKISNPDKKLNTLTDLLGKEEFEKVLIFSRTKRGADRLSRQLFQKSFRADSIHGDKSQNKRLRVLDGFKSNRLDILVATDVAARGLDIPNVTHVINYDEPQTYKDYIHRIGRTGRAGKSGNALTFVG